MVICNFFSRVLRDSTPRFVGRSVRRSVRRSHFTFFGFLRSLASLPLPKWWSDLKYGPCPPARDWGSRVSGLLLFIYFYEVFGLTAPAQMLWWPQLLPLPTSMQLSKVFDEYNTIHKNQLKQGWIHGYPSRVRVGRGHIWGHSIIWAGAVRPKTTKTQKK